MKRRDFVLATTAIGAGLAAKSDAAPSDSIKAGEETLKELMAGNARFVSGKSRHPHASNAWLKRLTQGQHPKATILACSDSRVPLELLFDQGFGDLFVIRVAGNVVTRYGIGSMEYAQHHLSTPLFMVSRT